jgi:hypothetical protein
MHASVRTLLILTLAVCAWGCSSLNQGPSRDRNLISEEEVLASDARNAYELVERLRPLWLQSRGDRSTRLGTEIVVYQDSAMLGGIDMLERVPIELVRSVRALDAAEAGRLPGLGSRHVERVIMIVTRLGP